MSDSSDEDVNLATEEVANAELNFLPERSKYVEPYELFNKWRLSKGLETHSETALILFYGIIRNKTTKYHEWYFSNAKSCY